MFKGPLSEEVLQVQWSSAGSTDTGKYTAMMQILGKKSKLRLILILLTVLIV